MHSCPTRRHIFLLNKKTRILAEQEDTSSGWTRRRIFLLNRKTNLLVEQEDMSSCWTEDMSSCSTNLLVQQEDMSSCWTRRNACWLNRKTCLLVQQEDRSYCPTGRHVFLWTKKTWCLLVDQEDMSSCWTRRCVFMFNKKTCHIVPQYVMHTFVYTHAWICNTFVFAHMHIDTKQTNSIPTIEDALPDSRECNWNSTSNTISNFIDYHIRCSNIVTKLIINLALVIIPCTWNVTHC